MERAGGAAGLAAALSDAQQVVSVQAVCNWRERGFPANKCKAIEALVGVSVVRLRPDDWRDYWPEAEATV